MAPLKYTHDLNSACGMPHLAAALLETILKLLIPLSFTAVFNAVVFTAARPPVNTIQL